MSLINKMLLDLDRRAQLPQKVASVVKVLDGLVPVDKVEKNETAPTKVDEPQERKGWKRKLLFPVSRRFQLAGLTLAILAGLAVTSVLVSQQELPNLATLELVSHSAPGSEPPAAETLLKSVAPPKIHPPVAALTAPTAKSANAEHVLDVVPPEIEFPTPSGEGNRTVLVEAKVQDNVVTSVETAPIAALAPQREGALQSPPADVPSAKPVAKLPPPLPSPLASTDVRPAFAIGSVQPSSIAIKPPTAEKKSISPNADSAADLRHEATTLVEQGRLVEAHEKYRDILGQYPRDVNAREGLVNVMLQQGDWGDAQNVLKEGMRMVPENFSFAQQLARLYAEQGNDENALELLVKNRENGKFDAEYLGFLAAMYQRLARPVQARETYGDALRLRPMDGRLWTGLAISFEAESNWAAARDAYSHVRASLNVDEKLIEYAERRQAELINK